MAGMLANQKQLNELTNKFDGRTPVRIHFLDNSSKVFLMHEYANIKDLVQVVLDKMNVMDSKIVLPYFALFESKNGSAIDDVLAMDALVKDVITAWNDQKVEKTAKFLFMVRLFMPCLWGLTFKDVVAHHLHRTKEELSLADYLDHAEVIDPNVLHLQFIQAVYNIITGRYPTTADQALLLGALHFLFKFGEYKSDRHVAGFLGNRIAEFIPIKHLKGTKGNTLSLDQWETKLYERINALSSEIVVQNNAVDNIDVIFFRKGSLLMSIQRKYMEEVYSLGAVFGCSFYRTTQKNSRVLPDTVIVGVYSDGIQLFDKNKVLLKQYGIEDILRWGFKPNQSFFFEIPPELNDVGAANLEFDTAEGKAISDLLTDYALAFLKEKEREEERANAGYVGYPLHAHSNGSTAGSKSASASAGNRSSVSKYKGDPSDPRFKAAVKIQALYRGFALRNEWAREDAAILIQAIFRGYKARVKLSQLIEQMIKNGEL